jgi:hypothetical protein
MRRIFGDLTFDVPEDFDEETMIILRAPPPKNAKLLRVTIGDEQRPAFVIKRVPLSADPLPLDTLAEAQERMLLATMPGATMSARTKKEIGGRDVLWSELVFDGPNGRMRQAHASLIARRAFVACVGTAQDDLAFDAVRDQLVALLETLKIG